jgi:hypothetical protein
VTAEVEAAVRAYFDAANVAIGTGETADLRRLTSPECPCMALATAVERIFADGKSVGAKWRLESVDDTGGTQRTRVVSAVYLATAYRDIDLAGRVIGEYDGHRNSALIRLQLTGATWRVTEFGTVKQEPS